MTRHIQTPRQKLCALALEEFTDRHENRGSPCAKAYGKFDGRFSQSWRAIVCCGMFLYVNSVLKYTLLLLLKVVYSKV
jgi:hypothetical protein